MSTKNNLMEINLIMVCVLCCSGMALFSILSAKPYLSEKNAAVEEKMAGLLAIITVVEKIGQLQQLSFRGDTVSADITNSGDIEACEIVQLYIRDPFGSVTRPVKELKGFQRTRLAPGETKTVTFTLNAGDHKQLYIDIFMQIYYKSRSWTAKSENPPTHSRFDRL